MSRNITYFASDFHLGAKTISDPRAHELRIVQWLRSIAPTAERLYLMGDIIDYWFEYKSVVPRGFVRFFGALAELSDAGVDVHWFVGNHDIWIFDYLPQELGITIHRNTEVCVLHDKRFFLAHGDGIDNTSRGFRLMRRIFNSPLCQRLYAMIHPNITVGFAHRWSSHSRINGGDEPFMGEKNEYLVRYAKRYLVEHPQSVDYFIFGHRHIQLDLSISSQSRVVILGDWINNASYGVFDGEQFVLHSID